LKAAEGANGRLSYQPLTGVLPRGRSITAMARAPGGEATIAYRGEIWTDGRGRAVVVLPAEARGLKGPFDYILEPAEASVGAAVTSELTNGRFTIETDEPHVKVAWRIAGATGPSEEGGVR
jgi:hypothetical protein